jgi:hypothetical protein
MNKQFLLGKLTPFRNIKKTLVTNQDTNDIIEALLKTHRQYKSDYDKISGYFWTGSIIGTCQKIFDFLKNNVDYSIEPDTHQTVKSPAAIIATSTIKNSNLGRNDCKHYSLFFAGILDSLVRKGKNINWCYRFANYKEGSRTPHHVFVVVNPQTKNEIWCDAVLDRFNEKKQYVNKIDKKMSLYSISGVECDTCDGDNFGQVSIGRRKKRTERKAARKQKRTARKAKRKARRTGENCKGRRLAKVAPPLIVARKAFLAVVRLNINNIGKKLAIAFRNPEARAKILTKWCGFGGDANLLKSAVAKVEAKLKRKGKISYLGVAVSTVLASALPIIKVLLPLASKFVPAGSKAQDILDTASEAAENIPTGEDQDSQDSSDQGNEEVSGLGQDEPTPLTLPNVTVVGTRTTLKAWHILAAVAGGFIIAKTIKK